MPPNGPITRRACSASKSASAASRECVESAVRGEIWRDPDLWTDGRDQGHASSTRAAPRGAFWFSTSRLSFWGGFDPATGAHHRRPPPAMRPRAHRPYRADAGIARIRHRTRRHGRGHSPRHRAGCHHPRRSRRQSRDRRGGRGHALRINPAPSSRSRPGSGMR